MAADKEQSKSNNNSNNNKKILESNEKVKNENWLESESERRKQSVKCESHTTAETPDCHSYAHTRENVWKQHDTWRKVGQAFLEGNDDSHTQPTYLYIMYLCICVHSIWVNNFLSATTEPNRQNCLGILLMAHSLCNWDILFRFLTVTKITFNSVNRSKNVVDFMRDFCDFKLQKLI